MDIVRRERTKALVDRHCLSVDGVRERSHMTRVMDPGQRRALSNPIVMGAARDQVRATTFISNQCFY